MTCLQRAQFFYNQYRCVCPNTGFARCSRSQCHPLSLCDKRPAQQSHTLGSCPNLGTGWTSVTVCRADQPTSVTGIGKSVSGGWMDVRNLFGWVKLRTETWTYLVAAVRAGPLSAPPAPPPRLPPQPPPSPRPAPPGLLAPSPQPLTGADRPLCQSGPPPHESGRLWWGARAGRGTAGRQRSTRKLPSCGPAWTFLRFVCRSCRRESRSPCPQARSTPARSASAASPRPLAASSQAASPRRG